MRHLAARALSPLVLPEQLLTTVANLCAKLPKDENAGGVRHNALHGALMQLEALVGNVAECSEPEPIVRLLLSALEQCMRLGEASSTCGPIRAACVRLWSAVMRLAQENRLPVPQGFVSAASGVCEAAVLATMDSHSKRASPSGQAQALNGGVDVLPMSDSIDPQHCLWLKECVRVWLGPAASAQDPDGLQLPSRHRSIPAPILPRLSVCLQSPSYDVRAAAIKQLLGAIQAHELQQRAATESSSQGNDVQVAEQASTQGVWVQLHDLLWAQMAQERCHKVVRRAMQALGLVQHHLTTATHTAHSSSLPSDVQQPAGPCSQVPDTLATEAGLQMVQRLYAEATDLETRCETLRCLGRAVGRITTVVLSSKAPNSHRSSTPAGETSSTSCTSTPVEHAVNLSTEDAASVADFMHTVVPCCDFGMSDNLRQAALDALASSNILLLAPGSAAAPGLQRPLTKHSSDAHSNCASLGNVLIAAQQQGSGTGPPGGAGAGAAVTEAMHRHALRAWQLVLLLLEDEEPSVRHQAAAMAQGCIDRINGRAGGQQLHKEQVTLNTFSMLVQQYCDAGSISSSSSGSIAEDCTGRSSEVPETAPEPSLVAVEAVGFLCRSVCDPDAPLPACLQRPSGSGRVGGKATAASAAWARRLFDQEADNHHEEPMLLAQMAALHLHRLLSSRQGAAYAEVVSSWRDKAARRLMDVLSMITETQERWDLWIGGALRHPEIHTLVFRLLLALWTASASSSRSATNSAAACHERQDVDGVEAACRLLKSLGAAGSVAALLDAVTATWSGRAIPDAVTADSAYAAAAADSWPLFLLQRSFAGI